MKVTIVNASPRKNWNTAQLLKEAAKGAESVGAEVEYVDLYDLKFTACRSCLACKRKGIDEPCKCYWKDELSPLLERIWKSDKLIAGSPIYFSQPTGWFRSFFERLVFPALSYDDGSSLLKGSVDLDVFFTMNVPEDIYRKSYEARLNEYFEPARLLNGTTRLFPIFDTLQVNDYSKYNMAIFSEEHKKERRETVFPNDLKLAFEVGAGRR